MSRMLFINAILLAVMTLCRFTDFFIDRNALGIFTWADGFGLALIALAAAIVLLAIFFIIEGRFRGLNHGAGTFIYSSFILCVTSPLIFYGNYGTERLGSIASFFVGLILFFCLSFFACIGIMLILDVMHLKRSFGVYGVYLVDAAALILLRACGDWGWIPGILISVWLIYLAKTCKDKPVFEKQPVSSGGGLPPQYYSTGDGEDPTSYMSSRGR